MNMRIFLLFSFLFISLLRADEPIIATGEITGNYYKVGFELNKQMFDGKAKVIPTSGSVENMLLVAEGKADVAIAQKDALAMLDIFYRPYGKKVADLVDILSEAYTETLHIIVSSKSTIKTLDDLNGKVMVCGGKKSGSSVTASYVEQNFNLKFQKVVDVSIDEGLKMLGRGEVDVVFYVTRAPSTLLSKYKNIRLLEVDTALFNNQFIEIVTLPKNTYDFMNKDIQTYGIKSVIIGKKNSNVSMKPLDLQSNQYYMLQVSTDTLKKYNKTYGNQALLRLDYFNTNLQKLEKEPVLNKIIGVHSIVNQLNYLSDIQHWKKDNYWSNPLEFIGTGYGDSEEYALMKYLFLVKLGIDPNKLKFISIDAPLTVSKDEERKENIALAYFHSDGVPPIIIESKVGAKDIYKYKNQFSYEVIKKSHNKIWDKVFTPQLSQKDIDGIIKQF
jgi:TRAP transporter TAXI family solute receptor